MKKLKPHLVEMVKKDPELQYKIAHKMGKQSQTVYKWGLNENHERLTVPAVLEVIGEHTNQEIKNLTIK